MGGTLSGFSSPLATIRLIPQTYNHDTLVIFILCTYICNEVTDVIMMMMVTMIIKKREEYINGLLVNKRTTKNGDWNWNNQSDQLQMWNLKIRIQKETICQMIMVTSIRKDKRADRGER